PMVRRGSRRPLVGGLAGRNEPHLVQSGGLPRLFGDHEVAHVNRIKGTPENADAHVDPSLRRLRVAGETALHVLLGSSALPLRPAFPTSPSPRAARLFHRFL